MQRQQRLSRVSYITETFVRQRVVKIHLRRKRVQRSSIERRESLQTNLGQLNGIRIFRVDHVHEREDVAIDFRLWEFGI